MSDDRALVLAFGGHRRWSTPFENTTAGSSPFVDMTRTGEALDMDERVVVSPTAGTFTPLIGVDTDVDVDQVIGQVCAGDEVVDVCTRFAGRLVAMVAWKGERVQAFQRVAWLRAA